MVDFHDPIVVAQDLIALLKLCHILDGLYIWEFVTTLDYDWHVITRVIQGQVEGRMRRWSIWLYSLTRLTTFVTVIINIINLSLTARTNCQVWVTFNFIFSYSTSAFSSLLIMLRTIAIWNMDKAIVGLTAMVWVVNASLLVQGISRVKSQSGYVGSFVFTHPQVRSTWHPLSYCSIFNTTSNTATFISIFITDFVLLVIMLFGLFRMRCRGEGTFALGRLLLKQGVVWIFLATVAELPQAVFICLNLNDAFNLMFLTPALLTMSIAATRMYRSLTDFYSTDVVYLGKLPRISRMVPNVRSTSTVPTLPRRVEVAVHTAQEMYPSSLMNENLNVISIGRDHPGQVQSDKPAGLNFHDDVGNNV